MRRDPRVPMLHMRDAAREAIEILGPRSLSEFTEDRLRALAILRLLTVFGEAAKRVPEEVRARFPAIPWRQAAATRDRIIHAYEDVDLVIVFEIVHDELPKVLAQLQAALDGW